jgi:hypothetical protein
MRWADESSGGWVRACREQQTWSREAFAGGIGGTGLSLCVDTRDGGQEETGAQCLATLLTQAERARAGVLGLCDVWRGGSWEENLGWIDR